MLHSSRALWAVSLCVVAAAASLGAYVVRAQRSRGRDPELRVDARLVAAVNGLAFRTGAELAGENGAKNLFISPASIELALAMTMNGARGPTRDGMAAALGLEQVAPDDVNAANAQLMQLLRSPDPKVSLVAANSLWGSKSVTFEQSFLDANQSAYEAEIRSIDFAAPGAPEAINGWVAGKTQGKIPELVRRADVPPGTVMVLANAMYLRGMWAHPFADRLTKQEPFTLTGGSRIDVPMMHQSWQFRYAEDDACQVVALPYGDRYIEAVVVLPRKGVSWATFATMLTRANWDRWVAGLAVRPGSLALPRIHCTYGTSLKEALRALGMAQAFDPQKADFTGMTAFRPCWVSDVIHKTTLDVDEQGTEASAATAAVMLGGATPAPPSTPFTMTVDRPFLFAIRDAPTGTILFLGTIRDPRG